MVFFLRKKARNLPKSFPQKSDYFIGLQLKMCEFYIKKFPKFLWTMLLSPQFFHKTAKIHHKKLKVRIIGCNSINKTQTGTGF